MEVLAGYSREYTGSILPTKSLFGFVGGSCVHPYVCYYLAGSETCWEGSSHWNHTKLHRKGRIIDVNKAQKSVCPYLFSLCRYKVGRGGNQAQEESNIGNLSDQPRINCNVL